MHSQAQLNLAKDSFWQDSKGSSHGDETRKAAARGPWLVHHDLCATTREEAKRERLLTPTADGHDKPQLSSGDSYAK